MKRMIGTLATLLLTAGAADAHVGAAGHVHGFMNGFVHPISGFDHVLAMVAVGAFAVVLGGRALWALPLTFMAVMLAGGVMGMSGVALPGVETGIAASVLVLGTIIALQWKAPLRIAVSLVGFFAVFHGFAHGSELPAGVAGSSFGAGFLLATAILHLIGLLSASAALRVHGKTMFPIMRLAGAAGMLTGFGILTGWV